jgi:hypothetical protein
MARNTIVQLIDDLDGTQAHETVKFDLDGRAYEIDLSNKNAAKLRNALKPYLEHGTRIAGRAAASRNGARQAAAAGDENRAIREWALRKGLDVAPRGRIRADIIEQYHRERGR